MPVLIFTGFNNADILPVTRENRSLIWGLGAVEQKTGISLIGHQIINKQMKNPCK